jgi:hypothetical protein
VTRVPVNYAADPRMAPILPDLGLVTHGDELAWAVTSPDDSYRYLLGRRWGLGPVWTWCCMNPSKARHDQDDQTLRKIVGFSSRGGAGAIVIVNVLAYSATDPKDMAKAARAGVDVRGAHNDQAIAWALDVSDRRPVAAWGKLPPSLVRRATTSMIRFKQCDPDCLGVNADGTPRHPLTLGYSTPFVRLSKAVRP